MQWIIIYKSRVLYHFDKLIFMKCPLCRKFNIRRLRIEKGVEIFECRHCELGFTNNVTKLMRPHQFGNTLYDFKGYKKEEKKLRERYGKLVQIITKYRNSGNVLDVGAGFGLFASILKKKGDFQIDIVEPVLKYRYIDITISNFFKTAFEKFKAEGKKYDIVVLMDVLEHFGNPLNNLKKAKTLLKKDGILVIQTPNYKSLMASICKDWAWWMIEDHKFFFSPNSLRKILNKTGFKTEYFSTQEDFEDFKKNLDGNFANIENQLLRKTLKGFFFFFFIPIYFIFRKIIWKLNYGGLIFAISRRREMI